MEFEGLQLVNSGGKYYFEDEALKQTHNPKGPNFALMEKFMQTNQLRLSRASLWPRWARLLPKYMRRRSRYGCIGWVIDQRALDAMADVDDHGALFTKYGRIAYTCQPYCLDLEKYKRMKSFWEDQWLHVDISYEDAWWFPGSTPLIVISQMPIRLEK